jgi:purine-binding chemotaxis protein CheW
MTAARKEIATIDWQKARDRLSRAASALDEAHRLSPERTRAVLEERALSVARIPTQGLGRGAAIEVVTFHLGEERYALETSYVREILRLKKVTPLPGTPEFLSGITNLRGQIVAVLDLRGVFGIANPASTELSRVIVLGEERIEFGVLADSVHEVILLPLDQVREVPGSVAGIGREYLRGVTADALIVLDGAALLNDPRLTIDLDDNSVSGSAEGNR